MGQRGRLRGGEKTGIERGIGAGCELAESGRGFSHQPEQLAFALEAVGEEAAEQALGFLDRLAVGGMVQGLEAGLKLL